MLKFKNCIIIQGDVVLHRLVYIRTAAFLPFEKQSPCNVYYDYQIIRIVVQNSFILIDIFVNFDCQVVAIAGVKKEPILGTVICILLFEFFTVYNQKKNMIKEYSKL